MEKKNQNSKLIKGFKGTIARIRKQGYTKFNCNMVCNTENENISGE
jgi:hypothetical protein